MLAKIPERSMHLIRWLFAIGWCVLIASLFHDPISSHLTAPDGPFAATAANGCYLFQGECRPLSPYPIGARIFWGMVVPLSILTLFILGHEAWRRICPLSFISQIPRALGWQRKRVIDEDSWLGRNALYLQFTLLFIGLTARLLLVNSDRFLLGIFLVLTLLSALVVGFLFDGKTWCHYICPMAPVQIIYSEPSGLLGSQAHTAPPKTITQSMCRTVNAQGQEKSACVACKVGCLDIDAEGSYWDTIRQPDRKLLYYAYVGLVIGFYLYFWLYSGNWAFLSAGVWNETNQLATLLQPGFYWANHAIPLPKLIAAPLTLTVAAGISYAIGLWAEQTYKRYNYRSARPLNAECIQNRSFAIATFIAFNLLFFLGVRPTLGYLPAFLQSVLSWSAVMVSSVWLVKTWHRTAQRYIRERDANLLRRQLMKLGIDLSHSLEGRSIDQLKPDELYALAKVLPSFAQDHRLQLYKGILQDALEQHSATLSGHLASVLASFQPLREKLGLSGAQHQLVLNQLQAEYPSLFTPPSQASTKHPFTRASSDPTVYRSRHRANSPPAQLPRRQPDHPLSSAEQSTIIHPAAQPDANPKSAPDDPVSDSTP